MFNIVLHQPEIPPNTGNVIRLCANTGCHLHLIHPLGFELDEKRLRRAGLDYHEWTSVAEHADFEAYCSAHPDSRIFAFSTRGKERYDMAGFEAGDTLLFGPETRGLPQDLLDALPPRQRLRIPMAANSRSLNLSNTVALATYEALRQTGFNGLE